MSCFLEILRCILCCEEDGSEERMRHHYEVLARSSSPPRFHQRISQGTSNYWSSAPIIMSKPESIEKPRVAPPKIFSSPSQSIQPRTSVDPAARAAPPKLISSPSQLIQPRNSVDPAARVAPPKVISSPSQLIQPRNSVDPAARVAPPKVISSPSQLIQPSNSVDPAARVAPPKVISSPSQLIQPRNSVDPSALVAPPKAISSPSQSIQPSNSVDPAVKNLISERDCRNQSLVGLARAGSHKESLAKQPGASRNLTTPSSPSLPVPERNLVDPSSRLSKLDQQKKLLGSLSGSDQLKRSPASLPGLDLPKKPPESPNTAVLRKPLSPSTYKDYFAALLYSEDYHLEKWSNFLLKEVNLKLHEESMSNKSRKSSKTVYRIEQSDENERVQKEKKVYVAFEIDSIPERRPYLLSRDFVFVQPSGKNVKPFKGIISRVMKSKIVLVEFGRDFHSQYSSTHTYDVSFSFNRVCLKRFHQAIEAAVDPSFGNFLFPDLFPRCRHIPPTPQNFTFRNLDLEQMSALRHILNFSGPPYLVIEKSWCRRRTSSSDSSEETEETRTEQVIREAILHIYRSSQDTRILITAPTNSTCDLVMKGLQKVIPDMEMFRANAAFRGLEDVLDDILPSTFYEGECFICPPLQDLCKFKVITSTFVSSFRLRNAGINAGHFTHIFMIDASFATEPETMITLANLANESTAVVVTGSPTVHPGWIRSDIAQRHGLKRSYLERLLQSKPYSSCDPMFVAHL
ncbi:probable RNA helicase SDE3 isoform X2 [Magnolia sinica]|uniref:probable RNA helicase SDE3 isoform X2 n=1 Tax=Magnolia sinica TaxID=86752 RepID=UPI00265A503F|nr:probable RNA helicase SDE3 isoform X2 [Magnolia sinica]